MGDEETVVRIGIADIYREVVGMRSDVQGLVIQVGTLRDDTKDHETRLRLVEGSYVTEEAMSARTAHSLRIAGVISGIISAVGAVIGVVIGLH